MILQQASRVPHPRRADPPRQDDPLAARGGVEFRLTKALLVSDAAAGLPARSREAPRCRRL